MNLCSPRSHAARVDVVQNYYRNGSLQQLINIIIESIAKPFVSALVRPSKDIIDKLHAAGILCVVGSTRF